MPFTPTDGKEYILVIGVPHFLGRAIGGKISQVFFDALCKATVNKTYDGFQSSLIQGTADGRRGCDCRASAALFVARSS